MPSNPSGITIVVMAKVGPRSDNFLGSFLECRLSEAERVFLLTLILVIIAPILLLVLLLFLYF